MRRLFFFFIILIAFSYFRFLFFILPSYKVAFCLLVFFSFLIKAHKQIVTLLWSSVHKAGLEHFFACLIQFFNSFMKCFLIRFIITIVDHCFHILAYLSSFGSRRLCCWQDRFAHLIQESNIVFTECNSTQFCIITLTPGK